jgi:hypothetical protein
MAGEIDFITNNRFPGAFIVDAALAFIPAMQAHAFRWPFWAQLILYWLTVGILRKVDGMAVRRGWRIWWRGGVKVPIIYGSGLIAGLGAMEKCNLDTTVCQRLIF